MLCIETKTGFALNNEVVRESAPYVLIQFYIREQCDVSTVSSAEGVVGGAPWIRIWDFIVELFLRLFHVMTGELLSYAERTNLQNTECALPNISGGGVRALVYAYSVYWQFVAHLTNPPAYHKSKKWKHPIWHWCSAYFKSISGKRIIYTSNVNNNMITGSYSQMLYVLRYSDDLGRQVRQPAILRWCLSTCMSSYVCMLVLYRFQCNFWCKYHISRDIS